MLLTRGLLKRYGQIVVLNGLDLKIERGEIVGLIGHNGAGKSTFIAVSAGLERADAGSIYVDGIDMTRHPKDARARLGVAPQHIALYPNATGRQNLRLFACLGGLRGRRLRSRIDEVTSALGLAESLDRPVRTLSGGQQRRLQAATALVLDPPVLLLDEPTVGADVEARKAVLSVIRRQADRGTAICYTTHYLTELEDLGATLALLNGGRIVARGTRAKLLANLRATLRLRFGSAPPAALAASYPDSRATEGGEVMISTFAPVEELAGIVRNFRDAADSLIGIDIIPPSLDDLYRQLNGGEQIGMQNAVP